MNIKSTNSKNTKIQFICIKCHLLSGAFCILSVAILAPGMRVHVQLRFRKQIIQCTQRKILDVEIIRCTTNNIFATYRYYRVVEHLNVSTVFLVFQTDLNSKLSVVLSTSLLY